MFSSLLDQLIKKYHGVYHSSLAVKNNFQRSIAILKPSRRKAGVCRKRNVSDLHVSKADVVQIPAPTDAAVPSAPIDTPMTIPTVAVRPGLLVLLYVYTRRTNPTMPPNLLEPASKLYVKYIRAVGKSYRVVECRVK